MVYQNSKMRMLEFLYDFVDPVLKPGSFVTLYTDTDSMGFGLTGSFEECVGNQKLYKKWKPLFFPSESTEKHSDINYEGIHELSIKDYENRTPGLFKTEYCTKTGGYIGLTAKTALFWGDETKLTAKGIIKHLYKKETPIQKNIPASTPNIFFLHV